MRAIEVQRYRGCYSFSYGLTRFAHPATGSFIHITFLEWTLYIRLPWGAMKARHEDQVPFP